MFADILPGQIQNKLPASFRSGASFHMETPIRVGAIQVTVRRYHFRFNPETKLHPQVFNFLTQTIQPIWQFEAVYFPVA